MCECKLKDWYKEKGVQKYLTKQNNPHFDRHHIKIPFRMLICGNSGSGKTSTLMNLIYNMPDTFEEIIICCKSKAEPLYEYLEDKFKKDGWVPNWNIFGALSVICWGMVMYLFEADMTVLQDRLQSSMHHLYKACDAGPTRSGVLGLLIE